MDRRRFLGLSFGAALLLTGCTAKTEEDGAATRNEAPPAAELQGEEALPPASPDPESPFAVDENVNMETIDGYLNLPGVVYRDMRLLDDPADYAAIGGDSALTDTLEGFAITPFPYIGTLAPLPVSGAYEGECLFSIEWGEGIEIVSATPNYRESMQIIEELFPRDTPIVLMCGGAGYAGMMRSLLLYLGYDARLLYNAGGMWEYTGYHSVQLIGHAQDEEPLFYLWRANIVQINFGQLHPVEGRGGGA